MCVGCGFLMCVCNTVFNDVIQWDAGSLMYTE